MGSEEKNRKFVEYTPLAYLKLHHPPAALVNHRPGCSNRLVLLLLGWFLQQRSQRKVPVYHYWLCPSDIWLRQYPCLENQSALGNSLGLSRILPHIPRLVLIRIKYTSSVSDLKGCSQTPSASFIISHICKVQTPVSWRNSCLNL